MTTFEAVPQGTFYAVRQNVARGITPTVSDWDTAPSNLERVTDGRTDLATGEGVKTTSGAGSTAYLILDLGRPVNGFVFVALDMKIDTGTAALYLQQRVDGSWSYAADKIGTCKYTDYHFTPVLIQNIWNADQIKLYFYTGGAQTITVKYYEVAVFEVVL